MVGNIHVAAGWCDAFTCHHIIKRFVFIFRTPDSFHFFLCIAVQPLARESKITHGDPQRVIVCHLLMQFVAVTTGNISKHGDDVFFLRRFINDHLFFKRIQLL